MFWDEKTIEMYRQAADYHKFHELIGAALSDYLTTADSVLDIGCGHGYLAKALASAVHKVTCVDHDGAVLAELCAQRPANLAVICGDYRALTLARHDYVLLSFFGRLSEQFNEFASLAGKGIITVKNTQRTVRDLAQQQDCHRETQRDIIEFCHKNQLKCQAFQRTLSFGQPFKNREDVLYYLQRYKPLKSGNYDAYLNRQLKKIAHPIYRYYLPKEKSIGITIIEI